MTRVNVIMDKHTTKDVF
jgi:hypothetical protein